ncbi:MAG TPA: EAL domain-containing protein [Clostridia bacterium]|nr:EAL domain-containing protein [Clostridia bacterium]
MKNTNAAYVTKLILILVCLILLQAGTGYFLYANSASILHGEYRQITETAIDSAAEILGGRFKENLNDFSRLDDTDFISSKYFITGVYTDGVLIVDGKGYIPSVTARQNFTSARICFHNADEIIGNGQTELCVVYTQQNEDGSITVLVQTKESFLADFSADNFDGFAITDSKGKVLISLSITQSRLTDFCVGEISSVFSSETDSVDIKINGESHILSASPIMVSNGGQIIETDLYATGYLSDAAVTEIVRQSNTKASILLTASTLGIGGLLALAGVAMRRQYDFLRTYKIKSKDKYVLYIDQMGRIVESNNEFSKNFASCNIFDNLVYFEEGKPVRDGDSIIVYVFNNENEKRLLNFFVAKVPLGFKLVGVDATEILKNSNANIFSRNTLTVKDLRGQHKRAVAVQPKLLLGVIDITNLKNLDTMFGRAFSEKVYDVVGKRVRKRFGKVYETPGGKMEVLVEDTKEIEYTLKDIITIMDSFNQAVLIDENLVNVNCKAGFAVCDAVMQDKSYEYLDNCANAALKRSSKEERVNFYVYHESQKKLYSKIMDKNWDIKAMLQSNSFEMEFQPQFYMKSDKPYGYEALFRVKKALSLEVDIFELITYAERTGNMILLGEFIFNEGMKFAQSIKGKGAHVSLNVSPVQLMQAGFVDSFLKIYSQYKLEPNSISIEITESFLMTNFDEVLKKLQLLEQSGINIHLDDFGVSYSSLLYLKKLPISAIKIDKEFIADIENNAYSRAITKTIINITKQLGQLCISEGVETEEQKQILQEMGCDVIQGFLMGKAMPADEARRLLE